MLPSSSNRLKTERITQNLTVVTGEASFGLALAGGCAGGSFGDAGLGGPGAAFFPAGCS